MKRLILCLAALTSLAVSAADITLAENGTAKAVIVIPEKARPIVQFAARELSDHLKAMTGAEFPVGVKPGPDVNFYLGFGNADSFATDEYVISARGTRIDIYGKDTEKPVDLFDYYYDNPDKGTLRGVYNFLDSLGIRWLAPGKDGVSIPECKNLRIPEQELRFKPYFSYRKNSDGYDFMTVHPDARGYVDSVKEVYLWGIRNHAAVRYSVVECHSERHLKLFENPEWLAHPEAQQLMKNGKRNPHYSCWTDPLTKEIWRRAANGYFSGKTPQECGFLNLKGYLGSKWPFPFFKPDEFMIDPMDHYTGNDGRCYCERCEEFRKQHPCKDDTEIIWRVIADIAKEIGEKYPGKYISTLIYPPKMQIPQTVEIPKNVRVRISLRGPSNLIFPHKIARDIESLQQWGKYFKPEDFQVSSFQCTCGFGGFLPGMLDSYPHLIARYIQTVKPYCAGIFVETLNLTHTARNLDVYIFLRLMWNPERDVEKELKEYFRLYYGPAAAPAREMFRKFEDNWIRIEREILSEKETAIGLTGESAEYFRKKIWSQVYDTAEMKEIESLMQKILKLSPEGTVYAKRARLLQKYLVQWMQDERSFVMEKEERRQQLKLSVPKAAGSVPSEEEWTKAPECKLISSQKMGPGLKAAGSFRLLASDDMLFIRAELTEPKMDESKTDPGHLSGNHDVWKDNCVELFFYAEKSKKFWQVIVNDNNAWSSQTRGRVLNRWEQMAGLQVKTERGEGKWIAEITIPLNALETDGTDLRFNFTRERNVKGVAQECSTWSPLAMSGGWHSPDNYGTLIFEVKKH